MSSRWTCRDIREHRSLLGFTFCFELVACVPVPCYKIATHTSAWIGGTYGTSLCTCSHRLLAYLISLECMQS